MKNGAFQLLLVEDNEDHAELVKRILQRTGVKGRVVHLSDGQQALDYLFHEGAYASLAPPMPDLILLDLRLPMVDGLEILGIIKRTASIRHIPVVILTTSDAERDLQVAYANHVNSYLVKPIGFEAFNQMIEQVGLYWMDLNHKSTPGATKDGPSAPKRDGQRL